VCEFINFKALKGRQISALGNAQGIVIQKILVAPRIQNDQRIDLFWREIKINPNVDRFNTRRTSDLALVKVYLRRENSRSCFYQGFCPWLLMTPFQGFKNEQIALYIPYLDGYGHILSRTGGKRRKNVYIAIIRSIR
jgi:hypothetical protein